ncbi:MAG: hypothetical protein J0H16_16695, partial [Alicycliphilus denitrificans]|nr:hypothetical protein [Alicycliphilus denitrificans]
MATNTPGQIIQEMPAGKFITMAKVMPSGSLQARKDSAGATRFYWRFSIGAKSERVLIGVYDSAASPKSLTPTSKGFSVTAATRAAEGLALRHYANRESGGHPALVAADRSAQAAQDEARRSAELNTLERLLSLYCDYLQSLGRESHKDARSIFNLHVVQAWPEVARLPAKEVSTEQFADMIVDFRANLTPLALVFSSKFDPLNTVLCLTFRQGESRSDQSGNTGKDPATA